MIKNKRVFITGGAGFIGSLIAKSLLKDNEITIFDNFTRTSGIFNSIKSNNNIRTLRGSIMDYQLLSDSMKDSNIVIHCAAIAGIDSVISSPTTTMKINVIGTYNVLEAANKIGKSLEKVIVFSTSEVFGSSAYRVKEESKISIGEVGEARWTYAVSKLAGEHFAASYYSEYNLPIVIIRPFNIYGPGQIGLGAMNKFITKAIRNETIEIFGDGNQIRSWCFVDDFVEALLKVLENNVIIGQSINIGNSKQVLTIYGLAETVLRVLKSKSKIVFVKELSADIELRIPIIDKMESVIGFTPKVSMEEGILRTSMYIKNEE
jgi:UDP-glucose 4-epimerase